MADDLAFLNGTGGASRAYTPASRKADGSLAAKTDTPIIELDSAGTHAKTADITALQTALQTALSALATNTVLQALLDAVRSTDSTGIKALDGDLATMGAKTDAAAAFGAASASLVALLKNLTTAEAPVQGVIDMPAAGTAYTAGRAVEIVCITAGDLTLTYADGSTRTRTFNASTTPSIVNGAITKWAIPTGSTFVGTLCNLK